MVYFTKFVNIKVIKGIGVGGEISFPTLNLQINQKEKLSEYGVYICEIDIQKKSYVGLVHYGPKSIGTDNINKIFLEVHVLDFNRNVYGEVVTIHLLKKIREVRKFKDVDALKKQIEKDIQITKKYFNAEQT